MATRGAVDRALRRHAGRPAATVVGLSIGVCGSTLAFQGGADKANGGIVTLGTIVAEGDDAGASQNLLWRNHR